MPMSRALAFRARARVLAWTATASMRTTRPTHGHLIGAPPPRAVAFLRYRCLRLRRYTPPVADKNVWDPPTVRLIDEESESTSTDEEPGVGQPFHSEVTHNRTLRVEVRTRLKVRRCKLSVSTGPQAG